MSETSPPSGLQLGPYLISESLGKGGMGRVWRAHHIHSGREVALKAITIDRAASPSYRRAFRREVEAVARVDHPFVTTIYDFGEATESQADTSDGTFRAGTPWLAMEYCDAGSMADSGNRPRSARELRKVLSEVLEALAHAHARGILHRDLKPENILVSRNDNHEREIRLADFGISQAVGEALLAESTAQISGARAGTPQYMAPEQVVAEWRNWGWWTDLYALGVVAYEWASGAPPFMAANWIEIGQMHLQSPPPPLRPRFPMPEEFHRWIHRLLAKAPFERFERASDALYALEQFEIVDDTTRTDELPSEVWGHAQTQVFDREETDLESDRLIPTRETYLPPTLVSATTATHVPTSPTPTDSGIDYTVPKGDDRAFHSSYVDVPPMPPQWRSPRQEKRDAVLSAGASLFGLREIPLVGRENERDRLWETLYRVRESGKPSVTCIGGESGVGKSALARWLTQRADETGAAFTMVASHEEGESTGTGLRRMLLTTVRGHGLSRRRLYERIELLHSFFGNPAKRDYDVPALTQLLNPWREGDPDDGVPRFTFPTFEARFETATNLIRHLARVRPILLWLDDVHWASEAIQFAHYVMQHKRQAGSVHIVLTFRSDVMPDLAIPRRQLEELSKHERTSLVELAPLATDSVRELVDALVGLRPDVRDQIADRAEGRPVHAVQLVGHLVEQNGLVPTRTGYVVRQGIEMPDSIQDLWMRRVQDAMAESESPIAAVQAITMAALLGMRIDYETWAQICRRTGVGAAQEVLELFATVGLVDREPDGWRLRHDLLRIALTNNARETTEWSMLQWMCADIVRVVDPPTLERPIRMMRHLVRGGFFDEVLSLAIDELPATRLFGRPDVLEESARLLSEALKHVADDPKSDPRWGHVRIVELASVHFLESTHVTAPELDEARQWALAHDEPAILSDVEHFDAEVLADRGDTHASKVASERSIEAAKRCEDPVRMARGYSMLAAMLNVEHQTEQARDYSNMAIELLREHDGRRLPSALLTRGRIAVQFEDFKTAEGYVAEAKALYRDQGSIVGMIFAQTILADIYRMSGRLIQAESACRRALDLRAWAGHNQLSIAYLLLAAILVERRGYDEARELYESAYDDLIARERRPFAAHLATTGAVAYAGLGEPEQFDDALERAWSYWSEGNFDTDVPRMLALGATLWESQGDRERARQTRELAARYDAMVYEMSQSAPVRLRDE